MDKSIISVNKLRFQRGYSYLNIAGVTFLVARELARYTDRLNLNIGWVGLWFIGIFMVWFVGYCDIRFGFWGRELEYAFLKNPEWMKIKAQSFNREVEKAQKMKK